MKTIKTYEGFFDFLKKKEKKVVTFDDVKECLYDLTDEHRIQNELNGDGFDGIFASDDVVFGKYGDVIRLRNCLIMRARIKSSSHMRGRDNAVSFEFTYNTDEISDDEVNELLLDCKSKLQIYDCQISFFIGWGRSEGSSSDKEWSDYLKMISKTVERNKYPPSHRNITVKITSPGGFN